MDALAAQIVAGGDDDLEWQTLSFDERVESALSFVTEKGLPDDLQSVRHVVVDEVQDLVGVRADLVLGAADGVTGGGRLHPARRSYVRPYTDFSSTVGPVSHPRSSSTVPVRLGDVHESQLFGSYRARSAEARGAAELGRDASTGHQRAALMRTYMATLLAGGPVEGVAGAVRRWKGPTVFLCRTNGEALIVAGRLREQGLQASLRAPADELPIAHGWGEPSPRSHTASLKRAELGARPGTGGARAR